MGNRVLVMKRDEGEMGVEVVVEERRGVEWMKIYYNSTHVFLMLVH
jgi:hypothetical protein